MRDDNQPIGLRARCALAVLIRGTNRGSQALPVEANPNPVEGLDQLASVETLDRVEALHPIEA